MAVKALESTHLKRNIVSSLHQCTLLLHVCFMSATRTRAAACLGQDALEKEIFILSEFFTPG